MVILIMKMSNHDSGDQNQGNDQSIQSQSLSKNQNQNQSHKNTFLQSICSNTNVTHNSDRVTCSLSYYKTTMQLNPHTRPDAICEKAFLNEYSALFLTTSQKYYLADW